MNLFRKYISTLSFLLLALFTEKSLAADGVNLYINDSNVVSLGSDFINGFDFNKEIRKVWAVNFYSDWCPHCRWFVPTWSSLASSTKGWSKFMRVAAIDCPLHPKVCSEFGIKQYPTIRLFSPSLPLKGKDFMTTAKENISTFTDSIAKEIKKTYFFHQEAFNRLFGSQDLISEIRRRDPTPQHIIVVKESEDSILAFELWMDFNRFSREVVILPVEDQSLGEVGQAQLDARVLLYRNKALIPLQGTSRDQIKKELMLFLEKEDIENPKDATSDQDTKGSSSKTMKPTLIDLVKALHVSFNEIPLQFGTMTVTKMNALKEFLQALTLAFPNSVLKDRFSRGLARIRSLERKLGELPHDEPTSDNVHHKVMLTREWEEYLKSENLIFNDLEWQSCKGSSPNHRGYTCAVWLLFHSMTIHSPPQHVSLIINAIRSYVKSFFGCKQCAGHFAKMTEGTKSSGWKDEEAILWLWKMHNTVNVRLMGEGRYDPQFPKYVFPSVTQCPSCYVKDTLSDASDIVSPKVFKEINWNLKEVVSFLSGWYINILPPPESSSLSLLVRK